MRRFGAFLLLALGVLILSHVRAQSVDRSEALSDIQKAAIEDPFNDAAFDAFLRTLPAVRTPEGALLYVFEGDLLLTRDELRIHLAQVGVRNKAARFGPELIVNTLGNRPDFWAAPGQRRLTFAVDRRSFLRDSWYEAVVANMARAGADWEAACPGCGIKFEHLRDYDSAPSPEKVAFIVRMMNSSGSYIAAAFFPSSPKFRRYLNIDPSYFTTTYDGIGVLRHELGHILGYRHEHTREVRGCYYEDNEWKPLTDYDPKSVMHYICGGGGARDLQLTELDRRGHRELYGAAMRPASVSFGAEAERLASSPSVAAAAFAAPEVLAIRFEGGEIGENILRAVISLAREGLLEPRDHTVVAGESLCSVYLRSMEFPPRVKCPERAVRELAALLSKGRTSSRAEVSVGETVTVPANVRLRAYEYTRTYGANVDDVRLSTDKKRWNNIGVQAPRSDGKTRLKFEGYEIRVPAADPAAALRVSRELDKYDSANIYVSLTSKGLAKLPLHSLHPSIYLDKCRRGESPGEASYAELLGVTEVATCPAQCQGSRCARILLLDTAVAPNPDIVGAVDSGVDLTPVGASAASAAGRACIEIGRKDEHHGTHLAGILVSQPNGFGFVGLSPDSRLHVIQRDQHNDVSLGDLIQAEMSDDANAARKVFVFAGQFPPYEEHNIDPRTRRLRNAQMRFQRSQAALRIQGNEPLWVTAAGQAEHGGMPIEIFEDSPMAPMNLGDLENVIVVTACDNCSDGAATLLPEAHYSQKMVTIAAPGRAIPGLADSSAITVMDGTSQATAYVAGVAAAMINCFGQAFPAHRIKKRLALTAKPAFDREDYSKLQSGIVDPGLALRDPSKHWLRRVGGTLSAVEIDGWCGRSMGLTDIFDDVAKAESFELRGVRRITRYRRSLPGTPARWVVFSEAGPGTASGVTRSGPGRADAGMKLLRLSDSTVVRLGELEELLLSKRINPVASCP